MSENLPMSVLDLQVAIDTGNDADIRAFYHACEIASGNEALLAYSQEHDFPTLVIDDPPANGHRLMITRDLSKVMYKSANTGPLTQLLSRHGIDFIPLGAFNHHNKMLLRQAFNLDQFDGRTTFAIWGHVVVTGMFGQTDAAKQMRARLMAAERAERTRAKVRESTGLHPEDLETTMGTAPEDMHLQQIEMLRQQRLVQIAQGRDIQQLKAANEDRKEETEALRQENQQLRAQIQQAASQADKALNAAQDDVTLEQFVKLNNLWRQLPPSHWRGPYARFLRDYSRDNRLLIGTTVVYGKPWTHEHTYKLQALYALQRAVLHGPEQFDMDLDDERSA